MAINLAAVLVSVVVGMALGAFWYSSFVFGRSWMGLTKLADKKIKKEQTFLYYFVAILGLLLMALVLSLFINLLAVSSLDEGLKVGFFVWSGFVATTSLTSTLFSQKDLRLFLLENGHHLLVILAMSAILTVWR